MESSIEELVTDQQVTSTVKELVTTDQQVTISMQQRMREFFTNKPWRTLIAYWLLGVCNNFGYVVMLSAANDIIYSHEENSNENIRIRKIIYENFERDCNLMSTGAILLADVLPCLIIKLLAQFLPFFVHIRVLICVLVSSSGFLLVAFGTNQWMSIGGVILTSFAQGLGEVTYLQYTSLYDKNVVSTWSSGTGGAGVIASISYAALISLGFQTALLIMLIVPVIMAISFWIILPKSGNNLVTLENNDFDLSFNQKLNLLPNLMKYMIPFALVYMFEYFINQGMLELMNYRGFGIDKAIEYHWLQVLYQVGVFLSRSSVNIFRIRNLWLLCVLQFLNVIVFTTEAIFHYIPYFEIIQILVFEEGLLGGATYVNTFYRISEEVTEEHKRFSMGITSFSDTIGISLAGAFAILAHNGICNLPVYN